MITGAAAVTPLGRGLAETARALAAGCSAIAEVPGPERENPSPAARIASFTTEPELPRARARRMDRGSQYSVVAARQCLADAGWEMAGREERTGILLGTGSAGAGPLSEFERQMADNPELASPFLFPNTVANAPASQTALELKIMGPLVTLIQKDPSAFCALFYGRMLLTDRRADALLVGAADEWAFDYHHAYERLGVTRTARHPGFALSEGASLVLLEREEEARARGARIRARVAAVVTRSAAVAPYERRATPELLAAGMRAALDEAGLAPADVALVSLSADGVPWTDAAERDALADVFGARPPATVALKLQLGENPSSGAAQIALAAREVSEGCGGPVLLCSMGAGGNFYWAVFEKA